LSASTTDNALSGQHATHAVLDIARSAAHADRIRVALLAAVGHDLCLPLSAAKAAVSCLRPRDMQLTAADRDDLLATAEASLDMLTPPGSPPLLTASARGDRVELRVIDCGPGVPEHDRERMFLPFEQLRESGGTTSVGLGLAVSRGLTEAMHGTLRPEQTPGGGLTLIISMPAAGHDAG
jgi:two-component system sensor histidine kinase KdpD